MARPSDLGVLGRNGAVRIALMSDIHANREAFEACLAHAQRQAADRFVFLGDFVGYGADPEWVLTTVMDLAAKGAVAVAGNHDRAATSERGGMSEDAAYAVGWTRARLTPAMRAFVDGLPLEATEEDRLYVHADASAPAKWRYVTDTEMAAQSFAAARARVTFVGHVHVPMLYGITATQKLMRFKPVPGEPIPLLRQRRWLGVLGSVGQPRDGNPAAAYSTYDTDNGDLVCHRVPYDVLAASAKIRAAGLPAILADRLFEGR
jgi:diadenosine tetraphosphatase ApaH/serine/threonine PP2A family protein phosphatase